MPGDIFGVLPAWSLGALQCRAAAWIRACACPAPAPAAQLLHCCVSEWWWGQQHGPPASPAASWGPSAAVRLHCRVSMNSRRCACRDACAYACRCCTLLCRLHRQGGGYRGGCDRAGGDLLGLLRLRLPHVAPHQVSAARPQHDAAGRALPAAAGRSKGVQKPADPQST
jgi:hypothetical protein